MTLFDYIRETKKAIEDATGIVCFLDEIPEQKQLPAAVLSVDDATFQTLAGCGQVIDSVDFSLIFCNTQRQSQLDNVNFFDAIAAHINDDTKEKAINLFINKCATGVFYDADIKQLRCELTASF